MASNHNTAERFVTLLGTLGSFNGPINISKVAKLVNLPQSTVHRLINQLVKLGLLRKAIGTHHYEIEMGTLRLGAALCQNTHVLVELAMPSLHRIVQVSKESCSLGLYRDTDATMTFSAQVQSPQPIRYLVNLFKAESVLWGTSGRAVLAYLPPQMTEVLLENGPISPAGLEPPTLEKLQEELALVRRRGYALSSRGERIANASGIAVPIFTAPGRVIGCLALATPSFRYSKKDEPHLIALMKSEALKISAELGRPA
jgi:DNA-binding IclR family transcriptional regulator